MDRNLVCHESPRRRARARPRPCCRLFLSAFAAVCMVWGAGREGRIRRLAGSGEDSSLHRACKDGDLATVKRLVETDRMDLEARDHLMRTPLHVAVWSGKQDIVRFLLSKSQSSKKTGVFACANDRTTALHFAANRGFKNIACLLLDHRANVLAKTKRGFTALHIAAKKDNSDIAQVLIKKRGKSLYRLTDNTGRTAMDYARQHQSNSTLSYFLELERKYSGLEDSQTLKTEASNASSSSLSQSRTIPVTNGNNEGEFENKRIAVEPSRDSVSGATRKIELPGKNSKHPGKAGRILGISDVQSLARSRTNTSQEESNREHRERILAALDELDKIEDMDTGYDQGHDALDVYDKCVLKSLLRLQQLYELSALIPTNERLKHRILDAQNSMQKFKYARSIAGRLNETDRLQLEMEDIDTYFETLQDEMAELKVQFEGEPDPILKKRLTAINDRISKCQVRRTKLRKMISELEYCTPSKTREIEEEKKREDPLRIGQRAGVTLGFGSPSPRQSHDQVHYTKRDHSKMDIDDHAKHRDEEAEDASLDPKVMADLRELKELRKQFNEADAFVKQREEAQSRGKVIETGGQAFAELLGKKKKLASLERKITVIIRRLKENYNIKVDSDSNVINTPRASSTHAPRQPADESKGGTSEPLRDFGSSDSSS
mmetsp:Transcript_34718/g.84003  ORF Transcript_34718/g.84003 Transcript_34718/m.84003 type:complete len:662 (-) Transcript_34718:120-2105(-)